jgi:anti-sigma regulatory factor (Ser/Thr protein kinase)
VNGPHPEGDLATIIRNALLPQRFPVRRDVELGAGVRHRDGSVCFHDNLWLAQQMLAAAAVRIGGDGVEGALAAASFRHLLRAALTLLESPKPALAACRAVLPNADLDAAVVLLDIATGKMVSATTGQGRIDVVARKKNIAWLAPGEIAWLSTGSVPPPSGPEVPLEGLDGLVGREIDRVSDGCAAVALSRSDVHPNNTATFVVLNDARAIPGVLRQVDMFFARHALAHDAVEGIEVALDEILSNVTGYAFRDGNAHEILVMLRVDVAELVIEIRDDGIPFDPLGIPHPDLSADLEARQVGGLGMHFVHTVLDEIGYQRKSGWNVLTLHKRLARTTQLEETPP